MVSDALEAGETHVDSSTESAGEEGTLYRTLVTLGAERANVGYWDLKGGRSW